MHALLALVILWSLTLTLPRDTSLFRALAPRYMDRLMADFGWTDEDAAAAMGSAGVESLGFTLMQEVRPTSGRGGLGPFQWTGPRRRDYEAWLARKGAKPNDFEASYGFLFRELTGPEKATVEKVRSARDLHAKVIAFERAYERAGVPAWDKRLEWAELALATWRVRKVSPSLQKGEGAPRNVATPAPIPSGATAAPPRNVPTRPADVPTSQPPSGGFLARLGALLARAGKA